MLKPKALTLLFVGLFSLPTFAQDCCTPTPCCTPAPSCCAPSPCCNPWYIAAGIGGSYSRDAKITVDSRVWDIAEQGYSDDLDDSAIWYAGIGRNFSFLRLDVTASHRGDYDYSKFQTGVSTTPGFTGDERTRKFKLYSNSVMFNAWLDGYKISNNLVWNTGCVRISPFIGGGLGVDYLTVHDFHTVSTSFTDSAGNVRNEIPSVNHFTTGSDFAWHAAAGLAAIISPKLTVEAGYNYFHGGDIPFPDYIGGTTSNARRFASVPAWNGRLACNEFFVEMQVRI